MKAKNISTAKKRADHYFSLFIRLRDSNSEGFGRCITCNESFHYKNAHCGHFQSRRYMATRYDEKNCALQCAKCNTFNQGEQYLFSKAIDDIYGEGTADELERKARKLTKFNKVQLLEIAQYYKDKIL